MDSVAGQNNVNTNRGGFFGVLIMGDWLSTLRAVAQGQAVVKDAMNALLVYPACPDTFWSYTHAVRLAGKRALFPPLGLLTVAALLPPEWNKRLVDLNVAPALTDQDLNWANYVFVGGMSLQRDAAREVIARCKAAGKIVIAGGPLFTMEYALFREVDHFALNEAELTLPPLIADLRRGCAKRVYRSREFADMAKTPAPMWELADLPRYVSMGVQFSRGCPFGCEFCNVTALLGRKPRQKTGRQVINELDGLHRAGWRGPVFFVDDNLIGNRKALKEDLLPALIKRPKTRHRFNTQVSIDLADDPGLVRDMVRAGFGTVFVGIETPMPAGLSECAKTQNQHRDLAADVRKLQQAGIEVQAGFILGFDSDTPQTFDAMVRFIQASGIVTAMVGMLQAAPGTQLYARLRREGRLLGVSSGDNADGSTNIVPRMGLDPLCDGYKDVLRRIYSPGAYYERVKTLLVQLRHPRRRGAGASIARDLPTFVRAMYTMGIRGEDRRLYWNLLIWAALRGSAVLSAAVRLAICGYHYRRTFEDRVLRPPVSARREVRTYGQTLDALLT